MCRSCAVSVHRLEGEQAENTQKVWSSVHPGLYSLTLQVIRANESQLGYKNYIVQGCYLVFLCVCSVEKDGSALSDERKTVQTSLFELLKDFLLKSPTTRDLHSILAYTVVVQDQQQVTR